MGLVSCRIFPTGNWAMANCQSRKICSVFMLYLHHLAHRYWISIIICIMEDRHARWTPRPQSRTRKEHSSLCYIAPRMFLCWFFPLIIFPLRGFFPWIYWPHILNNFSFGPSQENFVHIIIIDIDSQSD